MDCESSQQQQRQPPPPAPRPLTRASVSSLCLSSLAISDNSSTKPVQFSSKLHQQQQNGSTPSLVSCTDDEEDDSRAESPTFLRSCSSSSGWGSVETRRAYADLTALASSSPLLPPTQLTEHKDEWMPSLPLLVDHQKTDLSWGQFLRDDIMEDEDSDDEPMSF